MHQKEKVIAPLLEQELCIKVIVPQDFNTDIFGTFTRDVKRPGTQIATAKLKAEKADPDSAWSKFSSVGMVESVRSLNGETTVETHYFISSLESNARQFGNSIRSHWGIENSLHWVLDVALREDDCRIRKDNAPQNFAILRLYCS